MSRIPHVALLALACACLLPIGGCGGKDATSGEGPAPESAPGNAYAQAGPTRIRFRDVGPASGITAVNHSGRAGVKEYLLEAVSPGAAWFDYNGDGLLDVYVPDGDIIDNYEFGTVDDPETGRTKVVIVPRVERKATFVDQLWRNNGDGTFTDVAAEAGVQDDRWSFGATAFDYDADGDIDIHLCNFGPNRLWRNNGDGTFTDIAEQVGLLGDIWSWNTAAAVGDIDGDGRLDLYVAGFSEPAAECERIRAKSGLPPTVALETLKGRDCRWRGIKAYCGPIGLKGAYDRLYRQREDGTFEDMTDAWGVRPRVPKYAFTCLMFDCNEDGLLDIYVANDSEENFLWQQERGPDGQILFRDTSDTLGIKVGNQVNAQASMGMDTADIDGDGHLDIFVTNFSHDYNNLYIAKRAGGPGGAVYFKDRGMQAMGQQVYYDLSWGCGWYDFENDGDLDLFVANGHVYKEIDLLEKTGSSFGQLNSLFECLDAERLAFREIGTKGQKSAGPGVDPKDLYAGEGMAVELCSRQAAFADFDNDGLMDILVQNLNEAPTLLHNESAAPPGGGNWIKLGLRQSGGDREALGAIVDVRYGPPGAQHLRRLANTRQKSFLGCDDPRLHVALGTATSCDVTVTWPGPERATTEFRGLEAGRYYLLQRADGTATVSPLKAIPVH